MVSIQETRVVAVLVIERIPGDIVAMSDEMDSRPELANLTSSARAKCMNALNAIHRRNVVLTDLRGSHILLRPRRRGEAVKPVFTDFTYAEVCRNSAPRYKKSDRDLLRDIFNGVPYGD
ncbi:hypothetical protein GGF46_004388 [Coemansia sp. RSA 552]|nr:hypothetical protein GGF46_004388 [Coemansia sp. RSA 552]